MINLVSSTVPDPQSVIVTSSSGTMVLRGADITLTCSVQISQHILGSELSLLIVNASLSRPDGSSLDLANPEISDTMFIYTIRVNSFSESDVGNYICNATVRPQRSFFHLKGIGQLESTTLEIVIGKCNKT